MYDQFNNLGLRFAYHDGSAWRIFTNTLWTPSLNTWYHIAITRDANGTIRHFINGQQVNSWVNTYPLTSGSQNLFIGGINGYSSSSLNGNIDEVRISKGIARWTASFTPPDHEYGPVVAPVANFTGTPLSGIAPLNVSFTDTSTNYPTNWTWLFGAGNNSALQNPTHTYTAAGTYTVSHSATNAGGTNWTNRTAYITVTAPAPKVKFATNVSSGFAPLAVKFTDQSTGSPTRWNWSFGDGTWFNTSVAAQKSPAHSYTDPGNYTARLIACNAAGCNTTAPGKLITAWYRAFPTARFTTNVTTGTAPLAVKFTDTSIGLSLNKWNWSFGDGTWFNTTVASQKSPVHVYPSQGTYTSALTVSNASGSNMTVPGTVVVVTSPVARTYSMTNVEIYFVSGDNLAEPPNYYPGRGIFNNISNRLNQEGWQLAFVHNDTEVTKTDFGTTGGGLNAATFHYHFGHGNYSQALKLYRYHFMTDGTTPYPEQPYLTPYSVHYSELENRWGNQNKWVVLDACSILENANWGQALGTSHGILGFASEKRPSQDLPNLFLHYALDENRSVYQSYHDATFGSFTRNVTAAAIFSNDDQFNNDHFPGHGTIIPDEFPNNHANDRYADPWQCGGGPTDDKYYG